MKMPKIKFKVKYIAPIIVVIMYITMFYNSLFFGDGLTRLILVAGLTFAILITYIICSLVSIGKNIKATLDRGEQRYYNRKRVYNPYQPQFDNTPRETRIPGHAYKPTNNVHIYEVEYEDVK